MQIKVSIFDLWGDHTDKLRQEVLDAFKMEIPAYVILHFPPALVEKMKAVVEMSNNLKLQTVKFRLSLNESTERPKIVPYTKDNVEIPITKYEEHGTFDTLREFSLEYHQFYKAFSAHFHYNCSWWEMNFETDRFNFIDSFS